MKTQQTAGQDSEMTRRTFCNRVVMTSVGLGLAARTLRGEMVNAQTLTLAYPPKKIDGAELLMPGSSLNFNYPGTSDPAVLVRAVDGEYFAYSRKCAHLGCSIDFDSQRRCLVCPCHRGAYDARTGHVIFGPPPRPLDQITLQMRAGGELWAVGRTPGRVNYDV
jgi:Rieske Fe-S protein